MSDIVPYKQQRDVVDGWVQMLPAVGDLAVKISSTEFVPTQLRGKPAAVAAAILSGRELGLAPLQSLQHVSIVQGRPTLSAEMCRALVVAAGHEIVFGDRTVTRCVIRGRRRGQPEWTEVTFTMDDARRAKLDGKDNWRHYPRRMLDARATSELCHLIFPDVVGGIAVSEEMEDVTVGASSNDAAEHAPPVATAGPRTAQRKTRAKPHTARTAPPDTKPDEPDDLPPLPGEDGYDQPEPEPEPEPDKHTDPPRPITDPQMRKLQTLFTKHQIKDRGDRLLLASQLAGRDLETAKDLTVGEASTVIDTLERAEALAGEQFGDFLQRLTAATQSDPAIDIDPDTGEVVPDLSEGDQ